jgi:hypothetical protein
LIYFLQFCTHYATSDKTKFPTFARTRPPDTQISKSVASVLVAFNWTHVSFALLLLLFPSSPVFQVVLLYLKSPDLEFGNIATIILQTLASAGITVITAKHWDTPYHHGYGENPFYKLVEQTYRDTRSEFILVSTRLFNFMITPLECERPFSQNNKIIMSHSYPNKKESV